MDVNVTEFTGLAIANGRHSFHYLVKTKRGVFIEIWCLRRRKKVDREEWSIERFRTVWCNFAVQASLVQRERLQTKSYENEIWWRIRSIDGVDARPCGAGGDRRTAQVDDLCTEYSQVSNPLERLQSPLPSPSAGHVVKFQSGSSHRRSRDPSSRVGSQPRDDLLLETERQQLGE